MTREKTYRIIRFYKDDKRNKQRTIKRGLTLEQAKRHCKDPSTRGLRGGEVRWFDGYTEE